MNHLSSLFCGTPGFLPRLHTFILLAEVFSGISHLPVAPRVSPLLTHSGRVIHAGTCMKSVSTEDWGASKMLAQVYMMPVQARRHQHQHGGVRARRHYDQLADYGGAHYIESKVKETWA